MKKIFIVTILIIILYSLSFSQEPEPTTDINDEILKIKSELDIIKKDIDILKEKTDWFSFRVSGYVKVIYGVALWSQHNYGFNTNYPITHGFDFENKIRLQMLLGNKIIANSSSTGDYGTEVNIELRIKSNGVSEIKPKGSWYVVQGRDDQDNTVDIYMPRYERGGSNIIFGNFEVVLHEAQVKNILGTGLFINYKDVQEVHQYYGITGLVDVLTLNHEFLNNGYVLDTNDYDKFATVYYSFNPEDYEPESHTAEAMKLWSYSMLHIDPNDDHYNQKPHGISFGYSKQLADGFDLFIEAGASSKDAFDPRYFDDSNLDYGFFIKGEPRFFNEKVEFHPKLAASFAFQTGTTEDMWWPWSTFAAGLSIPVKFYLPSDKDKKDNISLETNFDLNVHILTNQLATVVSLIPGFTLFKGKFNFSCPFIYSYKNAGRSGFQRVGHEDVKWIDQLYDDHILNLGVKIGFDSLKLFGDVFQYKVENKFYFTYILEWDYNNYAYNYLHNFSDSEKYIHDIIYNEFILNYIGPDKLAFFVEFGLCYQNNARIVDSSTQFKYIYDRNTDTWVDTMENELMSWERWPLAFIIEAKAGFYIDVFKNFSVGLSAESPKLLLNPPNINDTIGDQQTYGIFKLWSKISF